MAAIVAKQTFETVFRPLPTPMMGKTGTCGRALGLQGGAESTSDMSVESESLLHDRVA